MSLNDPLANVLSHILNIGKIGRVTCLVRPSSKVIKSVLEILKENKYIEGYKEIENKKGSIIEVKLSGTINNCGVVKPRFSVTKKEFEKYEKRFLPAKDFGLLIISTSKGMLTHLQAKEKGIGGKLIAFVY